jgi:hypothetical protein
VGGRGPGGEMTQALYAHMNNKTIKIIIIIINKIKIINKEDNQKHERKIQQRYIKPKNKAN